MSSLGQAIFWQDAGVGGFRGGQGGGRAYNYDNMGYRGHLHFILIGALFS